MLGEAIVTCPEPAETASDHDGDVPESWLQAAFGADADATSDPSTPIGDSIGNYTLIDILGHGGQGTVYLADDTRLHRKVALKVFTGLRPGDPGSWLRFAREAEIASQLDHPGICTVFESGLDGPIGWIAMQYVRGESLAARIRATRQDESPDTTPVFVGAARPTTGSDTEGDALYEPARSQREAAVDVVRVVEKVARALHAAHEISVLHRDVKPGNIMIDAAGEPVLMDFGLARIEESELPTLTKTGELFGTPAYMSPEQLTREAARADRRSDVWSLGVTLFECLTLRRPFDEPTRERLYQAILTRDPPHLRKTCPWLPGDLCTVLDAALEKDRERRYQTALDFAEDLRRARSGEPILARPVSRIGRAWRWVRREPAKAAALVMSLVVVCALGYLAASWEDIQAARTESRLRDRDAALEAGFLEIGDGSPKAAIAAFEDALAIAPDSPEALVGIVIATVEDERPNDGLAALENARDLVARHPEVLQAKVHSLVAAGKTDEASQLEESLPDPASVFGRFVVALRRMQRGHNASVRSSERARAYRQAVDMLAGISLTSSRPLYHFTYAHALGHVPDPVVNARVASALTERWPHSHMAWYWAAFSLMDVDPERSAALFKESIAITPTARAYVNLGRLALERKDLDQAKRSFEKAIQHDAKRWEAHERLAHIASLEGRHDDAMRIYADLARTDARMADVRTNLATLYLDMNRLDEARTAAEEALEIDDRHVGALNAIGIVCRRTKKPAEAVEFFKRALDIDPDREHVWHNLGLVHEDLGNGPAAVKAYENAVRLNPYLAVYRRHLGIAYRKVGDVRQALAEFDAALKLRPGSANLIHNRGQALELMNRPAEAVRAYRDVLDVDPDHVRGLYDLGRLLARTGRPPDLQAAIEHLKHLTKVDPEHIDAHLELASAYETAGRPRHAVDAAKTAIATDSAHARSHYVLGNLMASQNKLEGAESAYRMSLSLDESDPEARCNLAHCLKRQGRFPEALAEMRKGHERGSQLPWWSYPSALWVAQCEQLVNAEAKLEATVGGPLDDLSHEDLRTFAVACGFKKLHASACVFWEEIMSRYPEISHVPQHGDGFHAAMDAALAMEQARAGSEEAPAEQKRLAGLALAWLQGDLAAMKRGLAAGEVSLSEIQSLLRAWKTFPQVATLRRFEGLPDAGRWRAMWSEVDRLMTTR